MKRQIKPFVKYALRGNALYFLLIVLLTIFSVGFALIAPGIYADNNKKLASLQANVRDLKLKKAILDSSIGGNEQGIEEDVKVMNKLIPETEDYFSIISALEELSAKTNFIITSYQIDLKNSQGHKLSLNITGTGDEQSFINFLQQYNFQGERLITAEKISLGKDKTGSFSLLLNFYSQKTSDMTSNGLNYQLSLQKVNEIRSKVSFNLQSDNQADLNQDYPKKSNPF